MKVHWIRSPWIWTHGLATRMTGTRDKHRVTCELCRWRIRGGTYPYAGGKAAGPTMEPLGACARRQVLAMVLGLA